MSAPSCPSCGTPVVEGSVCPRCLLGLGLGDDRAKDVADRPERIGPYRILDRLGEGGMGIVYRAEQTQPVRREVAIKVLKAGMDTRAVLARFEAERQALALMAHPGIARIFDAGETEKGRPYFVMELTNGAPVTSFCDQARLSCRERLGLVVDICNAVQHAHMKGIIHRDLKPSNILVATLDGRPQPRIIDFGIAKVLRDPLIGDTRATRHGEVLGTPEYMSPEQAAGRTGDVDTRSDVYSLGVVLYELLTGGTPFDAEQLRRASPSEVQRILLESRPTPPSAKVAGRRSSGGGWTPPGTNPRTLNRLLRGDLDRIVLKSLAAEPAARYESASDLAQDLGRYLRNEPVEAARPGRLYTIGKFVRRHRATASAALAAAIALTAFAIVMTFQAARIARERDRADAEAARANREARLSAETLAFMSDLFEQPSPDHAQGEQLSARDLLDRGVRRIEESFSDRPLVQAALLTHIGDTYLNLGLEDEAEPLLRQAHEIHLRTLGPRHPDTMQSADYVIGFLIDRGDYVEALDRARHLLDLRLDVLGEEHLDTLTSMNDLATILNKVGEFEEAETLMRRALDGYLRHHGLENEETLVIMHNMARLHRDRGRLEEAEDCYRDALQGFRALHGEDHPHTLDALASLSVVHRLQGEYAEAERYGREALEGRRRVLGPDHPTTLISTNNFGALLVAQGRLEDAEPYYEAALDGMRRVKGEDHVYTINALTNLGGLRVSLGHLGTAGPLLEQAVERARRTLPDENRFRGKALREYGRYLMAKGRHVDAEAALLEAHEVLMAAVGDAHDDTIKAARYLAEFYESTAQPTLAAQWRARTEPGS